MNDTERLDFVAQWNVLLRKSPETQLWTSRFNKNSMAYAFPAPTIRESIDQAKEYADQLGGSHG